MCVPKNRILVVDDDLDLLMLLERMLIREGYEVETAASLPEAEEIISQFAPDLVLLDINIQGDDGRKLCWQLKKSGDDACIKVVLMSGFDISLNRAVLFGADSLLVKPFHTDFLLHRIEELMMPHLRSSFYGDEQA